ncbi:MAG TPA: hypothetical protein PL011_07395, partial [Kiritimatiellia bacterium]|nr:hypothetical protein [Kiritimatiellia bacterium]
SLRHSIAASSAPVCFDLFSGVWKPFAAVFHGMEKCLSCFGGIFHGVEKKARIFHGMEKFSGNFPCYGKKVSTVWKKPTP